MWSRTFAASRSMAVRAARTQTRAFSRPAALNADLVQDLYLKELKAYKIPATKPTDAEGQVQKFSVPKTPKSPEEANLANELKDYETQTVDVEGSSGSDSGAAPVEEDWFQEEEEPEETKGAH